MKSLSASHITGLSSETAVPITGKHDKSSSTDKKTLFRKSYCPDSGTISLQPNAEAVGFYLLCIIMTEINPGWIHF